MRRFYIYTNMYDNLLEMEAQVLKQHNVKPEEYYEIDVFDENERLITTIYKSNKSH
jgi:hypothetical protein